MNFEDDDGVVLEKEAGILNPSLCVRTGMNNIRTCYIVCSTNFVPISEPCPNSFPGPKACPSLLRTSDHLLSNSF